MTKYRIVLMKHALKRAHQRGIDADLLECVINTGKITLFGKNHLKFVKKFKGFTVVCVDEIVEGDIKIVTVEVK